MRSLPAGTLAFALAAMLLFAVSNATASVPPRAQLRAFACQPALEPPNRSVSISAVMRPLAGTERLELKFDLLVDGAGPNSAPTTVRAGDLGTWISPKDPTLGQLPGDVWNLDKSVVQLAPATYRFRITFRWIGAHGRVIGSAVRLSRRCHQHELRPDLLVQSITVTPISGQPSQDLYTTVIANNGATAAGPFEVLFNPGDGSSPTTLTGLHLDAYSALTETFVGPLCTAASVPIITADAARQVHDLNRLNNQMTATCPPAAAGGTASKSAGG